MILYQIFLGDFSVLRLFAGFHLCVSPHFRNPPQNKRTRLSFVLVLGVGVFLIGGMDYCYYSPNIQHPSLKNYHKNSKRDHTVWGIIWNDAMIPL